MNKRIKNKISKRKNQLRFDTIFKQLAERGLTAINQKYENGYFVFTFGNHTVCHFNIKETPDWMYGIWLEEGNDFEIFGEHIEFIDKFKPTRTYLSYKNDSINFIKEVKNISLNPKLYFVDSLSGGDALIDYKEYRYPNDDEIYYEGYQVIKNYDKNDKFTHYSRDFSITQDDFVNKEYNKYIKNKKQREEDEEFDRKYAFNIFKNLPNLFDDLIGVEIKDENKKGWICSPQYKIYMITNVKGERLENLWNNVYDYVYEKNYNGERKTYGYQFQLDDKFYFNGLNRKQKYDYRYLKTT